MINRGETETGLYDQHALDLERGEDVVDRLIYDKVITSRKNRLILNWLPRKRCLVLDYGCGNGEVSHFLAHRNHEVVAFDLSKGMIRYARKVTNSNKISYLVASGENLPLRDEVFDAVVGIGVFHHLNLVRGLEECQRSLKPNGGLEFMEPNTLNPFSFVGRRVLRTSIHTPKERTFTPWFLRDTVRRIGFDLIETKMMSFAGYSLAFLSAWLSGKKQSGLEKLIPVLRKTTRLVILIDRLCESLPLLNNACWIIAMNMRRR